MVVVALIPVLGGILVGWGGYLGWRGSLRRAGGAGVRTSSTLRSDEAFAVGNKVAGLPTMAAGGIGVVTGLASLFMPGNLGTVIASTLGVVGLVLLVGAGGLLGHRAASAVPEPASGAACGGCACGRAQGCEAPR